MSTLNIRPLNSDLQLIAREELHENTDKIQESLDILRDWLKKSPHLTVRDDDQFLIAFIRGCKYSLERSKQKIDLYYTYRTHIPEMISDRDPLHEKLQEVIKCGITLPLPITGNPGSPRILFLRMTYDPHRVRIEDVVKVETMIHDILLNEDDNAIVSGVMCICDLANMSMAHIVQLQPAILKKAFMLLEESSPIRPKGIHYINAPKMFEQMFNLIKSLLSEKMKKRIFMHTSLNSFYSIIPRKMMPIEYDGEAGCLENVIGVWEEKLLSYREYFLEEGQKFGVDEKKRSEPSRNPILGIDGSFRQLQFD